jgi:hypothetical protein
LVAAFRGRYGHGQVFDFKRRHISGKHYLILASLFC